MRNLNDPTNRYVEVGVAERSNGETEYTYEFEWFRERLEKLDSDSLSRTVRLISCQTKTFSCEKGKIFPHSIHSNASQILP